jgi:hypothetical protein
VVACLWLGNNSDIVYGKMSTSNILTGYGPTLPSKQSNRWKVDWEFLVKLVVAPVAVATRVSDFVAATNPKPKFLGTFSEALDLIFGYSSTP